MSENLFMICKKLNPSAFTSLQEGYTIRSLKENELDLWKMIHFDTIDDQIKYKDMMSEYYNRVYLNQKELFFKRCLVVCDKHNEIVGTCFLWQAYNQITTVHWFKVIKSKEGHGIGRALLSKVFSDIQESDYPIYLHTHPECLRAIKLYLDFGFEFIDDQFVGNRENHIHRYIKQFEEIFGSINLKKAPQLFSKITKMHTKDEF